MIICLFIEIYSIIDCLDHSFNCYVLLDTACCLQCLHRLVVTY